MLFTSDNWASVHPDIMAAIVAENAQAVPAYGGDDLTARVKQQISEIFETPCEIYYASTGGAANGLALSQFVDPFGGIFCHEVAHIQMDECGTPEFYTGGAKLLTLPGANGKMTPDILKRAIQPYTPLVAHHIVPQAVSVTQATEFGTIYTVAELEAISALAKRYKLKMHMDGARFANAIARLGCSPAECTWKAGIDVLSLGATKNGALAAEAVIFFNPDQAKDFIWRQKRAGHIWSKARFMSAQWQAWFEQDRWLQLARHANNMAEQLAGGIASVNGCSVEIEPQANEVFALLPEVAVDRLRAEGAQFYDWVYPGDQWDGCLKRLVTSYMTRERDIDQFLAILRQAV
ncbi:MAG: threonine aldolase family protein [bacterium]